MKPLEHIALLRGDIGVCEESFEDHLAEFADKCYMQNEPYFSTEWTDLFLAETSEGKKIALDNLSKQYERIGKGEP